MSNKNIKSTYDKFIEKLTPEQLTDFEQGYEFLLVSELLLAIMKEDEVSIRDLAKRAKVSPTIVQDLRSGRREQVSFASVTKILNALGINLVAERHGNFIPLTVSRSE